ncbi:MAG: hypothetical protein VB091_11170 [Christensenella sp.]|nr:hypothetical protein [Christensenella sp.]
MKESLPKQFLKKQLLNIVFLALIVGGALTVYFLARAEQPDKKLNTSPAIAAAAPTAEASFSQANEAAASGNEDSVSGDASATGGDTATASPSPSAESKRVVGVPESVFATHLATSELFDAKRSATDPCSWTLTYGEQPSMEVGLQYTVDDGAVSSLELSFLLPPEYNAKSESTIEQYLAKSVGKFTAAREEAVRSLLPDLLPACDQNDALTRASVRIWAEEMTQISSKKDDVRDKADGCTFYAYQVQREESDVLVCLFVLEQ